MQNMSHWEIKIVVAIDKELLYKGGFKHRFDYFFELSYYYLSNIMHCSLSLIKRSVDVPVVNQ